MARTSNPEQAVDKPAFANKARGEASLALGRKSYALRPTHGAIVEIEGRTDRSILVLSVLAASRQLRLDQLGAIVTALVRAGAADGSMDAMVDEERISELIYEQGSLEVQMALSDLLRDAATGGRTATGEAKAVPAAP